MLLSSFILLVYNNSYNILAICILWIFSSACHIWYHSGNLKKFYSHHQLFAWTGVRCKKKIFLISRMITNIKGIWRKPKDTMAKRLALISSVWTLDAILRTCQWRWMAKECQGNSYCWHVLMIMKPTNFSFIILIVKAIKFLKPPPQR